MAIIPRKRTIRPSSRLESSVSYKIDTTSVKKEDTLVVTIDHEKRAFKKTYKFSGKDLSNKKSIHFTVTEAKENISLKWLAVKPLTPEPTIISLKSEWFKMGYYVYVVVMTYRKQRYFYIGMTGDRKHITARSPFYRMSGHFMLGKSTQNQIIKGLRKQLGIEEITDTLLCEVEFTYYAYLLNEFDKTDEKGHHLKRKYGEQVESCLIAKMKEDSSLGIVFNDSGSVLDYKNVLEEAQDILFDLKERIT